MTIVDAEEHLIFVSGSYIGSLSRSLVFSVDSVGMIASEKKRRKERMKKEPKKIDIIKKKKLCTFSDKEKSII